MKKIIFIIYLILCNYSICFSAVPSINGVSQSSNSIIITGSNLGSHPDYNPAQPFLNLAWNNFETGVMDTGGFSLPTTVDIENWRIQTSNNRANSTKYAEKWSSPVGTRGGALGIKQLANYSVWYTSFWFKMKNNTQSGKFTRVWSDSPSNGDIQEYNYYFSTGGSDTKIRGNTEYTPYGGAFGGNKSLGYETWHRIEHVFDLNAQTLKVYIDGELDQQKVAPYVAPEFAGSGKVWEVGGMLDYPTDTQNGGYDFDDVYFSPTYARVEIGNASTWSNCTHREIQIPTIWTSSGITVTANNGTFNTGDIVYLYVVDSAGSVSNNGNGYQITIGSSVPSPPIVTGTDPLEDAVNVTKNSNISITFSKTMDCSTAQNVVISPGSRGEVACSGNVFSFLSSGQSDGTLYTVTTPVTVKDSTGLSMSTPNVWSYTTAVPSATCDIDNELCLTQDTCAVAWPTNNWCPDEEVACKPTSCTNSCDSSHLYMCFTEENCTGAGLFWWEGACRDTEQNYLVEGPNLITNANLSSWSGDIPTDWTSYKYSNVRRHPLGVRLWDKGHILQASKIEPNTEYFYAYNYRKGPGTSEVYWYDNHTLENTTGTKTGVFTSPSEPIPDHGIYFSSFDTEDIYLNDFVLKKISTLDCSNDYSQCDYVNCESNGWFYYNNKCNGVASSIMFDNFSDGNSTGWSLVNNSTVTPSWSVSNQVYRQTAYTKSADWSYYEGAYSYWSDGISWDNYRAWVKIVTDDAAGIMFRYTDDDNYYRLSLSFLQGFYRLEKKIDGEFSTLAVTGAGPVGEQNLQVIVDGSLIDISVNGNELFSVTDDSLSSGTIALYSLGPAQFDNVAIEQLDTIPQVFITSLVDKHVYSGNGVTVNAVAKNLSEGGYLEFNDGDSLSGHVSEPFTYTFSNMAVGNHTIGVTAYDSDGELAAYNSLNIGVGGISMVAIGDSITRGSHDTIYTDNFSSNGRNISQGFTPILTGWLESNLGKPFMIYNEGISGAESVNGLGIVSSVIERYSDAQYYLVMYGTNDSSTPRLSGSTCTENDLASSVPSCVGTYKDIMRSIVLGLKSAGKSPLLALIPYTTNSSFSNIFIQEYNVAISQLLNEHNLDTDVPDFYSYFQDNPSQLDDGVHPNGTGYQSMSSLWYNELTNYWSGVFEPNRKSTFNASFH